jgi:hypothetical protein
VSRSSDRGSWTNRRGFSWRPSRAEGLLIAGDRVFIRGGRRAHPHLRCDRSLRIAAGLNSWMPGKRRNFLARPSRGMLIGAVRDDVPRSCRGALRMSSEASARLSRVFSSLEHLCRADRGDVITIPRGTYAEVEACSIMVAVRSLSFGEDFS